MIGYIKGIVDEIGVDYIIVEANNIGYKLNVSNNTIAKVKHGETVKIYSQMIVREDDISLCGFYSKEEQDMFKLLTSVSKIGPKVGLSILSFATPDVLKKYIINSDTKLLSKAPGVGKKTAERIILELKDKVGKLNIQISEDLDIIDNVSVDNVFEESVEALLALGYNLTEAQNSVNFVKQPGMNVEDIIKKALEYILMSGKNY